MDQLIFRRARHCMRYGAEVIKHRDPVKSELLVERTGIEYPRVVRHAHHFAGHRTRFGESQHGFEQVIAAYRNSPEFTQKEPSTQRDYRRWLDRISERFGNTPTETFEDRGIRRDIIEWRNLWAEQPRTADKAAVMMATLLGWAMENGILSINVAARIKQLHHVTRADLIWEDQHWTKMEEAEIPAHLMTALFIARWTGLRLGDLVQVSWDEVGPKAIIRITNKRKGRAVIPILPELRKWLDSVPEKDRTGTLLKNSRGEKWTESGLGSVFQKNKPEGFDRRIHDIRGTFCTMLILKGLTDEQAAMIMGWTAKRVAAIRVRYVDEERVILHLTEKLSA